MGMLFDGKFYLSGKDLMTPCSEVIEASSKNLYFHFSRNTT